MYVRVFVRRCVLEVCTHSVDWLPAVPHSASILSGVSTNLEQPSTLSGETSCYRLIDGVTRDGEDVKCVCVCVFENSYWHGRSERIFFYSLRIQIMGAFKNNFPHRET